MLIGPTHVHPITATSAYADVEHVHCLLLTVVYIPRQQYKMYIKLLKILFK